MATYQGQYETFLTGQLTDKVTAIAYLWSYKTFPVKYLICMEDNYSKPNIKSLANSSKIGRHGPRYDS
jgi:hypothetical protein